MNSQTHKQQKQKHTHTKTNLKTNKLAPSYQKRTNLICKNQKPKDPSSFVEMFAREYLRCGRTAVHNIP